jgi:GNAT superfamily N-acetyltransferase
VTDRRTVPDPPATGLLALRVGAYLRSVAAVGEHGRIGPFLCRYAVGSDHPMLNYAVPDDFAEPSASEIEALVAEFAARRLLPRLEYAAQAAPRLEALLLDRGFAVEGRYPLLTCAAAAASPPPDAAGFELGLANSSADHVDALVVGADAFAGGEAGGPESGGPEAGGPASGGPASGGPASGPEPPTRAAIEARRKLVAAGGAVALAREAASGTPAGSAVLAVPMAGVSEIAGVGTRPAFRRRGVAGALVGLLVGHAARQGVELLWLTPGDQGAERVYAAAGFERSGVEMVHVSRRA